MFSKDEIIKQFNKHERIFDTGGLEERYKVVTEFNETYCSGTPYYADVETFCAGSTVTYLKEKGKGVVLCQN